MEYEFSGPLQVADLPVSDSGCGAVYLLSDGETLSVFFSYHDGSQKQIGRVIFDWEIAHNFASEPIDFEASTLPNAYDSVVKLESSNWSDMYLREYPAHLSKGRSSETWSHFVVYFSNYGLLNVLARGATVEQVVSDSSRLVNLRELFDSS